MIEPRFAHDKKRHSDKPTRVTTHATSSPIDPELRRWYLSSFLVPAILSLFILFSCGPSRPSDP
ncbi:hypothetical protein JW905_08855, partial [bacterium]|nr:hypothetical protein [candidate division CSSED10-310 bacterium]